MKTVRCTTCATEFTDAEIADAKACPACGDKGVPCAIADDVTLKINWHELRILTIWASNFAETFPSTEEGDSGRRVLAAIVKRLEAQFPEKTPLTIAGELRQVAKVFRTSVEMRKGGKVERFDPPEEN